MKICVRFALLLILPLPAFAAISEKNFTSEQLQSTANYLGVRIEKPKTKILKCDPDAEAAKTWMGGPLHSLIDEKVKAEAGHFKNNPSQMVRRVQGCHRVCACGLYAEMMTLAQEDMGKNPNYKKVSKILEKESKQEDSMACAKKLSWFCGSELESYLRGTQPLKETPKETN